MPKLAIRNLFLVGVLFVALAGVLGLRSYGTLITGAVVAGNSCTLSPLTVSSTTTCAHGLAGTPNLVTFYFENLIADQNYSVGDRIYIFADSATTRGFVFSANTTNITITTSPNMFAIVDKSTFAVTTIGNLADWKVVVTPYRIN